MFYIKFALDYFLNILIYLDSIFILFEYTRYPKILLSS